MLLAGKVADTYWYVVLNFIQNLISIVFEQKAQGSLYLRVLKTDRHPVENFVQFLH